MRHLHHGKESTASTRRRLVTALALAACVALVSGCTPTSHPVTHSSPGRPGTPTPTTTRPPTRDPIAGLTLEQRVGQIFMMGTTAAGAQKETLDAVSDRHVGNVFLSGRSYAGVKATAAVVARFRALVNASSTAGLPLLVSTDQEGGQVQVLHGSGFSMIPTGVNQGGMSPAALTAASQMWGGQLAAAGVNMDLAPVVDLVGSAATAPHNPPIGALQREFGYTAPTIVAHASAFRAGMTAAGVVTVVKHFPGLGFVTANTDTSSGVTDRVTGPDGANVGIYRDLLAAGTNCVMVSSAIYTRLDAHSPAVFSRTVVTRLLRTQLGFDGVIMSDDLSGAKQVLAWTPAQRAILAIQAGVDIVLVSRLPDVATSMIDAVVAKARTDPAFATLVDNAARRVVELKSHL